MNYERDNTSTEGGYTYREYSGHEREETGEPNNYTRPDFYAPPSEEQGEKIYPESASYQTYNPYSSHANHVYETNVMEEAGEYRGPQSMEGYTADVGVEQREAAERGSAEGGARKKGGLAGIGTAIVALFTWLLKLKGFALVLKFGWGAISALVTIGAYSIAFGWQFAVGIVALLFIHELGHALVLKLKGMPVGGIVFIPFFGAMTLLQRLPTNAKDDAEISIGGPIAGAISAFVCLAIAQLQPDPRTIWAALAYFGFFINLLNLIPVVPFDGGRILAAVDRRVWIVGFIALLGFQVWEWINGIFSFWLILIIVLAASQFFSGRFKADSPQMKAFYTVPLSTRILVSILYFALAAVLFLGMSTAHNMIV
ncbi:site-2 protease family protein [Ktedonospora formicarum]|uniref:Peptidase M50 domain-containing protein n=1 Tax=Ktedonospora formicarum TaxID=2778364 RepID=A0A8J3HZA4_9CHLR|nr:site-2 protease family protein [Ktedonospora formicarum]GHO42664.1 hypothetical protein KSX_08270 [Ktedonospora formicarum]